MHSTTSELDQLLEKNEELKEERERYYALTKEWQDLMSQPTGKPALSAEERMYIDRVCSLVNSIIRAEHQMRLSAEIAASLDKKIESSSGHRLGVKVGFLLGTAAGFALSVVLRLIQSFTS